VDSERRPLQRLYAGSVLVPDVTGSNAVDVRLNGESVATIDGDSTGRGIFLPTAPGDEVILLTENEDATARVREQLESGQTTRTAGSTSAAACTNSDSTTPSSTTIKSRC
jgi:hypothetical protein